MVQSVSRRNIRAEQARRSPVLVMSAEASPLPIFFLLFTLGSTLPPASVLETGPEGRPVSLGGTAGGWRHLGSAPHAPGRFPGCPPPLCPTVLCDVSGSTVTGEGVSKQGVCRALGNLLMAPRSALTPLQAEGRGGQPDAPLCPDALWGHSVLDGLADPLHPRL